MFATDQTSDQTLNRKWEKLEQKQHLCFIVINAYNHNQKTEDIRHQTHQTHQTDTKVINSVGQFFIPRLPF